MGDLLQAVAEPRRRMILRLVWAGEREAGEIHRAMGEVTFGAVSQHLRVLREAGAVRVRREGRRRLYRVDRAAMRPLRTYLERMWAAALGRLKTIAELEERVTLPPPRRAGRTKRERVAPIGAKARRATQGSPLRRKGGDRGE